MFALPSPPFLELSWSQPTSVAATFRYDNFRATQTWTTHHVSYSKIRGQKFIVSVSRIRTCSGTSSACAQRRLTRNDERFHWTDKIIWEEKTRCKAAGLMLPMAIHLGNLKKQNLTLRNLQSSITVSFFKWLAEILRCSAFLWWTGVCCKKSYVSKRTYW